MKIKVCGLKNPENIQSVASLGPEYMGFIFYDKTPRYAKGIALDVLKNLPQTVIKTGVFVNESLPVIFKLIDEYGFNAIQLHGSESPEFCAGLKEKVTVIKAFGINEAFDFEQLKPYADVADFFLFDTKTPIHGGSGKTFDWGLLDRYKLKVPFFLSGGIGPDNLAEVINVKHPQFYGVDLNSRFEIEPGIKDIQKLEAAFSTLKTLDIK